MVFLFVRLHQTITSALFRKAKGSQTDDSFVQINDRMFGQVVDMLWLPEYKASFLVLQEYEKVPIESDASGLEMIFPVNQFPVPPTLNTCVVHVTKKTFIQKIVCGELVLKDRLFETGTMFFSVRPNEWFRF